MLQNVGVDYVCYSSMLQNVGVDYVCCSSMNATYCGGGLFVKCCSSNATECGGGLCLLIVTPHRHTHDHVLFLSYREPRARQPFVTRAVSSSLTARDTLVRACLCVSVFVNVCGSACVCACVCMRVCSVT